MSMDRKRFGAGILGGLLLGLIIVTTTAPSGGLFASFVPAVQNAQVSSSSITSSASIVLSTSAAETTTSASSTAPYQSIPGANSSLTFTTASTSVSKSSSSQGEPSNYGAGSSTPTARSNALSASRLDNMEAQPLLLNGLVLLPIMVAIALGVLLYRVSNSRGRAEEQPAAE